jgi:hypothetical protein
VAARHLALGGIPLPQLYPASSLILNLNLFKPTRRGFLLQPIYPASSFDLNFSENLTFLFQYGNPK